MVPPRRKFECFRPLTDANDMRTIHPRKDVFATTNAFASKFALATYWIA